ncbi:MAG: SEC-C motif-containing protein [Bacteroidia bacterium]|jgi:SEC-C motif-containing protein
MNPDPTACPCGLGSSLEACCGPLVEGVEAAASPERLMRSRYTAFTLGTSGAIDYLVESHHPDFRQPGLKPSLESTCKSITWTGLTIVESSAAGPVGIVEFVATFDHDGEPHQLQERSSFVRESGKWLYTTGELDPAKNGPIHG